MGQTIKKIEIVEYHEGLASKVAEMWNLSRDGWGGDSHVTNEEKVRTQEANSSNLNLYLAMDGETVVGYCGLCEYREDEGALYIPLLNVRTDYHGMKIGKMLMLKALERSVELGWPRLDLYTWPGNTKAVPLYKKCGFFWEDRDDVTHLMNFMPTVLNTEAVQEFFQDANWYDISTRTIDVSPDGRKENDFTYFEYKWEDNLNELRMEFERTGRGLRLIETNDYLISAEVENFKLVCNTGYTVKYIVKNKTGKPLNIDFQGENHKLVDFPFHKSVKVERESVLEATFQLKGLDEEQSNWRTHPTVKANLIINGRKATLAVGILPKLPAFVSAVVPGSQCYLNVPATLYLNVENNFDVDAKFILNLPENELLTLSRESYEVFIPAKGKVSIPVSYKLTKFGFYSPKISIEVLKQTGDTLQFEKQLGVGFKGIGAKFHGECDDYWHIYNGLYHLYLRKFDNELVAGRQTKDSQKTIGLFPKLGKPYSSEFSKRKPKSIEYEEQDGGIVLRATYESNDFPGIELVSLSKLYAEGLLEQSYMVRNNGPLETDQPVWVYQPIYHELYKPVFATENQIVEINEQASSDYGLWESKNLSENWLFSRYTPYAQGITWPMSSKVQFEPWYLYIEHEIGILTAASEVMTEPVYFSFGAYQSWQEFRDFSNKRKMDKVVTVDDLMLTANTTDDQEIVVSLVDKKTSFFQGSIELSTERENILSTSYVLKDEVSKVTSTIKCEDNPLSFIKAKYEINGVSSYKSVLAFNRVKDLITVEKKHRDGHQVLTASNGQLTISATESFYPALFSLTAFGKEWLHSSFPKLKPKSWWNPWSGGIRSGFQGINDKSFAKEKSTVSEAVLFDQFKKEWKGIKISTNFIENEEFKGLGMEQYYLMLPGMPIVAYTTRFIQNTGAYIHYKKWNSECSFMPGDSIEKGWIKSRGDKTTYIAGKTEFVSTLSNHILIGSIDDDHILQIIADHEATEIESYVNKEVHGLSLWREIHSTSGADWISPPSFFVALDSVLNEDEVKQLQRITFSEG